MIRVIIEIVPGGNEKRKTSHAGAEIVCMPGSDGMFGDYAVSVGENHNPCAGRLDWTTRGHLFHQPKNVSVWKLIEAVARFAGDEAEKSDNR